MLSCTSPFTTCRSTARPLYVKVGSVHMDSLEQRSSCGTSSGKIFPGWRPPSDDDCTSLNMLESSPTGMSRTPMKASLEFVENCWYSVLSPSFANASFPLAGSTVRIQYATSSASGWWYPCVRLSSQSAGRVAACAFRSLSVSWYVSHPDSFSPVPPEHTRMGSRWNHCMSHECARTSRTRSCASEPLASFPMSRSVVRFSGSSLSRIHGHFVVPPSHFTSALAALDSHPTTLFQSARFQLSMTLRYS